MYDDKYPLYDLKVTVIKSKDDRPMVCRHIEGDYFTVTEDDFIEFGEGVRFPMYSLAAILPYFLPNKENCTKTIGWVQTLSLPAQTPIVVASF